MSIPTISEEYELTQDKLKELLTYNPETGRFTWNKDNRRLKAGMIAGSWTGYHHQIRINRKLQMASRLAFLYMTGKWPTLEMDHINRDGSDDRWINLREASRSENSSNRGVHCRNKLGVIGVCEDGGRYRAYIGINSKTLHLGMFNTIEEASIAYQEAAKRKACGELV